MLAVIPSLFWAWDRCHGPQVPGAGWRAHSQKRFRLSLPMATLPVSPRARELWLWSETSVFLGQRGDNARLLSHGVGKGEVSRACVSWLVWADVSCTRKAAERILSDFSTLGPYLCSTCWVWGVRKHWWGSMREKRKQREGETMLDGVTQHKSQFFR